MKSRSSNIELLRIFAMIGVVVLHICNPLMGGGLTAVPPFSARHYVLCFLESLFIGAVNLYVMISGYFMSRSTKDTVLLRKPAALIFQVSFFRLLFYFMTVVRGSAVLTLKDLLQTALPINYFVILYCALFCISPYLNKLLQGLSDKAYLRLVLTLVVLFALEPTLVGMAENHFHTSLDGLDTVSAYGDQLGYTIVNFVLCYIIGGGLARLKPIQKPLRLLGILLLCLGVSTLWFAWGTGNRVSHSAEKYNNPLVLGMAVLVFLLFRDLHMGSSRVINFLAKASFTVFLTHTFLFRFVDFPRLFGLHPALLPAAVLLCAVLMYLVAVPVWFVYDKLYHFFEKYALLLWKRLRNTQE